MEAAGTQYIEHGSRSDKFKLWYVADLHFGNKACAIKEIERDLQAIKADPFSFWIGG